MSSTVVARSTRFTTQTRVARRASRKQSRAVAWAEIVALVLIAVALVAATIITAHHGSPSIARERIRIDSGQTLWTIAVQHPIAGLSTEQAADRIASLNHINDGHVAAGSTICIPTHPSENMAVACR